MMNFTKRILALFIIIVIFGSCKKKLDDFFQPADNAAPSIYAQLQANGKFTRFLSLIDKAGYKQILGSAGFWTIFAPTDSAFTADTEFLNYLKGRGINSLDAIDSANAINIVQYLLVFNGFNKERLDDYQSSTGYILNSAFKRRTANYTGFYNDTTVAGVPVKAIASNRNFLYVVTDNNNKHIPYFTSDFFTTNGLLSSDYTNFYPGTPFTGFNVANAKVTQQDLLAENGMIHIIDHVVSPLLNLDQYLKTKGEFSEFRKMIETFMVSFDKNVDATARYKLLTGSSADVFVKTYSNLLAFSLNNENHLRLQENDGQRDSWSLMAPRNDVFTAYVNSVLLENYTSVNFLPPNIIADLINSHMWRNALWPSKFNSTLNFLGESPHISFTTNIIDKKILSNGFFYGLNKVNEPNVFSSVYGKAYLNPRYSLMTQLLNSELRSVITNINAKYTVLMISDAVFAALGYGFNSATNLYTLNGVGNTTNGLDLARIINSMVIETQGGEMDGLGVPGYSGTGSIKTFGGEVINWNGNQIISAGTAYRRVTLRVDSFKTAVNGRVLFVNQLPYFSPVEIGKNVDTLGNTAASEFNLFRNYLINSTVYDASNGAISGTLGGNFYTVFAPNNQAIRNAITAGLLPGTAAVPNFTPTLSADKAKVEKFILYHIIDKTTILADKKNIGVFPTLLKLPSGDPATVTISYPGNVFEITDLFGGKARLVTSLSNQLANRAVIHLIDNYLKYP